MPSLQWNVEQAACESENDDGQKEDQGDNL